MVVNSLPATAAVAVAKKVAANLHNDCCGGTRRMCLMNSVLKLVRTIAEHV